MKSSLKEGKNKMSVPLGFEMMIKSVIKMLGLDPVKVMNSVEGIHAALQSSAADLRQIRENQKILMEHFGLTEWKMETSEHERTGISAPVIRAEFGNGSERKADVGAGT